MCDWCCLKIFYYYFVHSSESTLGIMVIVLLWDIQSFIISLKFAWSQFMGHIKSIFFFLHQFHRSAFSWGRGTQGREPDGVPKPQENAWELEPPLPQTTLFIFPHFCLFHKKEIFSWEHGNGELSQHSALGFSCWGRFLKIHIETKSELFMTLGEKHLGAHIISMDIPPIQASTPHDLHMF